MIAQTTIDRVFEEVDIVDAIAKTGVEMKQEGKEMVGCCPFHNEKSASFKVNRAKGMYKCFGCGEGGNAVNFYMKNQGLSYPEAIRTLAKQNNIEVVEEEKADPESQKRQERNQHLFEINERALKVWSNYQMPKNAMRHPNAVDFGVAYAPNNWETIKQGLKDISPKALFDVGLLSHKNETDHYYDAFVNRLIFPIRDARGNLRGFGGESLLPTAEEKKKAGKYINTKGTEIYNKSFALFGIDQAKAAIRQTGFAYACEGYWDVIASHRANAENAVAPCGTSFTVEQMRVLRKYTSNLTLLKDGDDAGIKSALKDIPTAMQEGFIVKVAVLPDGQDPDDVVNHYYHVEEVDDFDLNMYLQDHTHDGILWYTSKMYNPNGDPSETAEQRKKVAALVALLKDGMVQAEYMSALCKEYKWTKTDFKRLVENASRAIERENPQNTTADTLKGRNYQMPKELNITIHDVKKDVLEYGFFTHKHKIYMQRNGSSKKEQQEQEEAFYYFKCISNFKIKIIQHMFDKDDSKQLVEIENVYGKKRTFDASTNDFATVQSFRKMLRKHGNFQFDGAEEDYGRLDCKLMDEMGDGRMLGVMGWQPEKFWAFSNKIITTDGAALDVEQFGQVKYNDVSYYLPGGNSIYKFDDTVLVPQKKAVFKECELNLEEYWKLVTEVHGTPAYNAILFTCMTVFSDVVFRVFKMVPLVFFYGPGGTGKDQIISSMMSLFGEEQDPIDLSVNNTDIGIARGLAQFRNMMAHMSEFRNGLNIEKKFQVYADRKGHKRGAKDHSYDTETVPVNMTVAVTGNYYPQHEPAQQRLIVTEMTAGDFGVEQVRKYNELSQAISNGVSGLLPQILRNREAYEKTFREVFNVEKETLKAHFVSKEITVKERMIACASVMGATLRILEDKLPFPFTYDEWRDVMTTNIKKQWVRMEGESVISAFWNGFLTAIRDSHNPLIANHDYKLAGKELKIQFKPCYTAYKNRCQGGLAESEPTIRDAIKRHKSFIDSKGKIFFNKDNHTSGYIIDVTEVSPDFQEELLHAMKIGEMNAQRRGSVPTEDYESKKTKVRDAKIDEEEKKDDLPF